VGGKNAKCGKNQKNTPFYKCIFIAIGFKNTGINSPCRLTPAALLCGLSNKRKVLRTTPEKKPVVQKFLP